MLENGQDLYIWLGRDISPDYLQAVFGTDDLQHVDPRQVQFYDMDNTN
jgi:protein transport protein SEC24